MITQRKKILEAQSTSNCFSRIAHSL